MPEPIIIGYTTHAWDPETIHNHIAGPQVPKNYKKEDTIQKWKEENLPAWADKWARMAPWLKATGRLESVYAIDVNQGEVFDSTRLIGEKLSPGARFVRWLLDKKRDLSLTFGCASPGFAVAEFIGFNPKPCLRLAGMNAIRDGVQRVPRDLWYGNDLGLDPKEMLLESEVKDHIPLAKLLTEAPGGPIEVPVGYMPHQDAKTDAVVVTEMCIKYQLIPAFKDTSLRVIIDDGLIPSLEEILEKPEKAKETEEANV